MEKLRMPASYATLPEEELPEIFGGGELGDGLTALLITSTWMISSFRGVSSPSPSRLCLCSCSMLLFPAYRFVENIYKNLSNWFGYHDDTFSAVSSFRY